MCGPRAFGSPPPMSSRHHNSEPLGRWHATIHEYTYLYLGYAGPPGRPGEMGFTGATGPVGPVGAPGRASTSTVYRPAPNIQIKEEPRIEYINGQKILQGPPGERGRTGATGTDFTHTTDSREITLISGIEINLYRSYM